MTCTVQTAGSNPESRAVKVVVPSALPVELALAAS